jgi:dihydrolipoamide dehydrogenase
MTSSLDLLVLGGGPGGYVAALRAAQLGLKVGLIEKEALGGVCLNQGCIPSKTLLTAAELFHQFEKAAEWGVEIAAPVSWNLKRLFDRKDEVVSRMRQGLEGLCQKRKVQLIRGEGTLAGPGEIRVGSDAYRAKNIIIATGSSPTRLDLGISETDMLSSEEALALTEVPASLLILGGGPEGCEFALIFRALGAEVTVAEAKDRLLPGLDPDAGTALRRALEVKGITVLTGEKLTRATPSDRGLECELKSGTKVTAKKLLVCVGRTPNTANLGLEAAGIRCNEKKAVAVDGELRTTAASVYAIGDVTGNLMMAHAASCEGYAVAGALAGRKEEIHYDSIPSVVYTYPQAAEVGLNEEKARARNIPFEIGRFSFLALGRAHAKGHTQGFVKIVGHARTHEVLGGTIVGDGADDLINVITLAVKHRLKVEDLRRHVAPHPSASEAVVEAAHLFFKEGLHFA